MLTRFWIAFILTAFLTGSAGWRAQEILNRYHLNCLLREGRLQLKSSSYDPLFFGVGLPSLEFRDPEIQAFFDERSWISKDLDAAVPAEIDSFLERLAEQTKTQCSLTRLLTMRALLLRDRTQEVLLDRNWKQDRHPLIRVEMGHALLALRQPRLAFDCFSSTDCLSTRDWCVGYLLSKAEFLLTEAEPAAISERKELLERILGYRPGDLSGNYMAYRTAIEGGSSVNTDELLNRLRRYSSKDLIPADPSRRRMLAKLLPLFLRDGIWDPPFFARGLAVLISKHELFPELKQVLGGPESEILKEIPGGESILNEFAARHERQPGSDSRPVVVAILKALVELTGSDRKIRLGPNLIQNGGAEIGSADNPVGWEKSPMSGLGRWCRATYELFTDDFYRSEGERSLRVDGLWSEPCTEFQPARAGWAIGNGLREPGSIELTPGDTYVLSFLYRTERIQDGSASVWTGGSREDYLFFPRERALPPTDGRWVRFLAVARASELSSSIELLLRLWGVGTVWFDEICLRELEVPELELQQPLIGLFSDRGRLEELTESLNEAR